MAVITGMGSTGGFSVYVKPPVKLIAELKKMPMKSKKFKQKCLKDIGINTKNYAKMNIAKAGSNFTGTLNRSVTYNVYTDYVEIKASAPHAIQIEEGFMASSRSPRWVHRDKPTWGGKTVGDWMDAKGIGGEFLKVGGGPIGRSGIHFMQRAKLRVDGDIQGIIDRNRNELALGK